MCFCIALAATAFRVRETESSSIETPTKNQSSTDVTPLDQKDSEAQQAMVHAEALRANWTEASLREAIVQYDKAALLWTSISDFANAADATLKSGGVYFLINEYKQALERYQNAELIAEKTGNWLAQARALSEIGRVQSYLGNNNLAQQQLTKSLRLFEQQKGNRTTEASNAYAEALSNLAEVSYSKGDFANGLRQLESALDFLRNDPEIEAKIHLFKGYITGSIGQSQKAFAEISLALRLYQATANRIGEGLALTAMGVWHSLKNEDRAIELHNQAIKIFRAAGDRHSEALARSGVGQVYENLKVYSDAGAYYKSALELFENIGSLDGMSTSTFNVARAQHLSGNSDQALTYYEHCLKLSRTAGKLRTEAYALKGIAALYSEQGHHEPALKQYQKIQKFYKSIGDLRGQAMALNAHGDFFLKIGEKQKALDIYRQEFTLSEKIGDNGILLSALYNLARANQALDLHDIALSLIKQSLDLIEDVRGNTKSPDFRASYFSGVREHYDLCIDILMQLDRLRPGQGFAAEAFFMSEKGRARLLLDLLSESRFNIREGAAKDLIEQERRLKGLLRLQTEYEMHLSVSGNSTEITEVADQMAQLRYEYQAVQAQLRKENPRLFAFEQFKPVNLERIQNELRDSDTMLLEYALGDERSYLWAVTYNSVQYYVLPHRKVIEDAANELYKLITARQGSGEQSNKDYQASVEAAENLYSEKAQDLSRMLLGPLAGQLATRRLVIVTEGALQYIPFDMLPVPLAQTAGPISPSKTLVVETNEVVVLPSASTLLAIRGAQNDNRSTGKLVAIIADPVFSRSDDRVQIEAPSPATATVDQDPDAQTNESLKLARLAHASEEADAISAVAPGGTTLVAKGFDASRETAMSSEVSRAQIVHFATHGFLDDEHPELSAVVLTMMDRNGVRRNGLMPLPDIYSLNLSAELTVLSACQTALGKDIKGEGLVGLTHSFISAGSKSVVASLWKVDDRATALLMADFYDSMFQKGMSPAAALRAAKLKMMRDARWSAPYYWAGFVLQGEYNNHITVEHHSWRRSVLVVLFLLILIAATLLILQKRKRRNPPEQFT